MNYSILKRSQAAIHPARAVAELLVSTFEEIRGHFRESEQYRQSLAELQALSDRNLADIGIRRQDIGSVARENIRKSREMHGSGKVVDRSADRSADPQLCCS